MDDPHIKDADPQHYNNPNYGGVDGLALQFIKRREEILDGIRAQQATNPIPLTEAVMDESAVKAQIAESNARYAEGALKREIINSYYNHPLINHDFASGRGKNMDPGRGLGPALIVGSGPTFDDDLDLIRGWKGQIVCSTSQGTTLVGLGKSGFIMVAVDVKTESDEYLPLDCWEGKDVMLVTHPGVDPEAIMQWRGKKKYFKIIVHQMPFYMDILPLAYPMITTTMYVFGCAAAAQVTIASIMGYNPLYLVGCDFGYPDDRCRFRQFKRQDDGRWIQDPPYPPVEYRLHAKVNYRNGCPSDSFQAYYKQTFFNVWRLSLSDIFRVGDKGGLYEVPGVSAEEVLNTQGGIGREKFISNKDKKDISERYLQQYGTYTFEYPNGQVEFVVFNNVEEDLPKYISAVNAGFVNAKMPGVLILGEEKGRISYLRNDEAWRKKEARWQWGIRSPQSPTETTSEES